MYRIFSHRMFLLFQLPLAGALYSFWRFSELEEYVRVEDEHDDLVMEDKTFD